MTKRDVVIAKLSFWGGFALGEFGIWHEFGVGVAAIIGGFILFVIGLVALGEWDSDE